MKYYEQEDWIKAQTLFQLVIPEYRGKEEAEELFFKFAYTHYYSGEYILAAYYFKNFASTFYNSEKREEASFMSAYSNYQLSPNAKLDQSYTKEAIDGFQQFINANPQSERVGECNALIDEMRQKLEEKAIKQGELYYNIRQYQSALKSFNNTLKDFPETAEAEKIYYLMLKSSYKFAERSVFEKRQERYEETISLYNKFIKKFPSSEYKDEVKSIFENSKEELKNIKA